MIWGVLLICKKANPRKTLLVAREAPVTNLYQSLHWDSHARCIQWSVPQEFDSLPTPEARRHTGRQYELEVKITKSNHHVVISDQLGVLSIKTWITYFLFGQCFLLNVLWGWGESPIQHKFLRWRLCDHLSTEEQVPQLPPCWNIQGLMMGQ